MTNENVAGLCNIHFKQQKRKKKCIKKNIFSHVDIWLTPSNHMHYYLTNTYYTFTQAHMEFLGNHLLEIILK